MNRTILGITEAGEPLLQQASEAICRYREAKSRGSAPMNKPERQDTVSPLR